MNAQNPSTCPMKNVLDDGGRQKGKKNYTRQVVMVVVIRQQRYDMKKRL